MNIDTFNQIRFLLEDREKVLRKIRAVRLSKEKSGGFGITIEGSYQPDDFIAGIRPFVQAQLIHELAAIDANLESLGFEPELPSDFAFLQPDWSEAIVTQPTSQPSKE